MIYLMNIFIFCCRSQIFPDKCGNGTCSEAVSCVNGFPGFSRDTIMCKLRNIYFLTINLMQRLFYRNGLLQDL